MAFFGLKTYFKKIFLGYFCPPIKVMWKNRAKRASKWVFIKVPPPNRCQFQRPLMVGLTLLYTAENKVCSKVKWGNLWKEHKEVCLTDRIPNLNVYLCLSAGFLTFLPQIFTSFVSQVFCVEGGGLLQSKFTISAPFCYPIEPWKITFPRNIRKTFPNPFGS